MQSADCNHDENLDTNVAEGGYSYLDGDGDSRYQHPIRPASGRACSEPNSDTQDNKGFCRRPPCWGWAVLIIVLMIMATLVALLVKFTTSSANVPTTSDMMTVTDPSTLRTTPTTNSDNRPATSNMTNEPTPTAIPVYNSCQAAYEDGKTESGVYTIKSHGGAEVNVYCEMDLDDGGWTVFQRRSDGSEDFYKGWNEYKNGFGNIAGEFWLGNENLHLLTSDHNQKLKIEMKLDNETAIVDYASFWVGNETEKFKLHVARFSGADPPGDSLLYHSNQAFSTQDQDNDASTGSCANLYPGAWWYKSCYRSNLNGVYGAQSNTGVLWKSWKGASTSLTSVRMMFKTVKVYRDCLAAYKDGKTKSGVYRISPDGVTGIDIHCEQELGGGGWTVFQRRMDGTASFKRPWGSYKKGFGSIDSEFWLGNDFIHLMTVNQDQQLKVEMEHGGLTAYAQYSEFWIEGESGKYRLHVDGFSNGQNNPGDSLAYSNGKYFSTHDRDHDGNSGNCAVGWQSAWWFGSSCTNADLNALYGTISYRWYHWSGHQYPLTASRMMVKTK